MKAESRQLGVSFCDGKIQLAEVERGRKIQLLALAEYKSALDFGQAGVHLTANHPQLGTMVQELGDALKRNKISTRNVSFALPSDPIFLNVLPVDNSLKGPRLTAHLQWEIQQHYPDATEKDFVVDATRLGEADTGVSTSLLVAVRRGMVGFLQKTAQQLKLNLRSVDVDHFAAEEAARINYPEIKGHSVLLASVRFSGVNVSVLHDGHLIDYRFFSTQALADILPRLVDFVKHFSPRQKVKPPQAILLAGLSVPPNLIKELGAKTGTQVLVLNAVRKLKVRGKVYQPFVQQSHQFAAAIGLALRAAQ